MYLTRALTDLSLPDVADIAVVAVLVYTLLAGLRRARIRRIAAALGCSPLCTPRRNSWGCD